MRRIKHLDHEVHIYLPMAHERALRAVAEKLAAGDVSLAVRRLIEQTDLAEAVNAAANICSKDGKARVVRVSVAKQHIDKLQSLCDATKTTRSSLLRNLIITRARNYAQS